jgi:putative tricarboxylic transport membrane protein
MEHLRGTPQRALRIAHLSSVSGDTFSDIVLFVCAPFLAVAVESFLDLPEKTALIILSLSFIAAVMGGSVAKGLMSISLGMVAAFVATGEHFYPRLTFGVDQIANGFPLIAAVLGVLILGEVFRSIEDMSRNAGTDPTAKAATHEGKDGLQKGDIKRIIPYIWRSSLIGTAIGALPGVGSTLAATLGYTMGKRRHEIKKKPEHKLFGEGVPEGIAATEAANSAVSGANLIPVLSLGIPGNAAAVFLILAADSIGGFNPGPSVFNFTKPDINPELVVAFGLFTLMACGNLLNWTIGGYFMRAMGIMARIPNHILMPVVLLVTLTAIYIQQSSFTALWITVAFGMLGYIFRRIGIPVLPFVIAFILAGALEQTGRQAFAASGGDPWFLLKSPVALLLLVLAFASIWFFSRKQRPLD